MTEDGNDKEFIIWGSAGLDSAKRNKGFYNTRISFEVTKIKDGVYANAHIKIFNLSRYNKTIPNQKNDTKEELKKKTHIKLYAGYEEDFIDGGSGLYPIFEGDICHIDSQLYIDGETHLYCYAGIDLLNQKMPPISLNANTTIKNLFDAIRTGFKTKDMTLLYATTTK